MVVVAEGTSESQNIDSVVMLLDMDELNVMLQLQELEVVTDPFDVVEEDTDELQTTPVVVCELLGNVLWHEMDREPELTVTETLIADPFEEEDRDDSQEIPAVACVLLGEVVLHVEMVVLDWAPELPVL